MNQSELISSSVRHFLAKNKVKIIIGTPCFGGLLHNGFFQSVSGSIVLERTDMKVQFGR